MSSPGQETGQPQTLGLDWASYLQTLIEARGSLAALAEQLASQRGYVDSLEAVERGLRRLRQKGHRDGGVWGRRAIAAFGMPKTLVCRVRWMGLYHSRFSDLPTSVCTELLSVWNRPPMSESGARVWVQLGLASVALRTRERAKALEHLQQAALAAPASGPQAQIELALVMAFAEHKDAPQRSADRLKEAERLIRDPGLPIDEDARACFWARWIDQRAYPLNKPKEGAPDHEAARALYLKIPETGPPFALCRRHNGLGWSELKLGRRDAAVAHARLSVLQAGDSGSLRLRAMALNLLAAALGGEAGEDARARAARIAARLEDEALAVRFSHRRV